MNILSPSPTACEMVVCIIEDFAMVTAETLLNQPDLPCDEGHAVSICDLKLERVNPEFDSIPELSTTDVTLLLWLQHNFNDASEILKIDRKLDKLMTDQLSQVQRAHRALFAVIMSSGLKKTLESAREGSAHPPVPHPSIEAKYPSFVCSRMNFLFSLKQEFRFILTESATSNGSWKSWTNTVRFSALIHLAMAIACHPSLADECLAVPLPHFKKCGAAVCPHQFTESMTVQMSHSFEHLKNITSEDSNEWCMWCCNDSEVVTGSTIAKLWLVIAFESCEPCRNLLMSLLIENMSASTNAIFIDTIGLLCQTNAEDVKSQLSVFGDITTFLNLPTDSVENLFRLLISLDSECLNDVMLIHFKKFLMHPDLDRKVCAVELLCFMFSRCFGPISDAPKRLQKTGYQMDLIVTICTALSLPMECRQVVYAGLVAIFENCGDSPITTGHHLSP